jgi:hypothetical protein
LARFQGRERERERERERRWWGVVVIAVDIVQDKKEKGWKMSSVGGSGMFVPSGPLFMSFDAWCLVGSGSYSCRIRGKGNSSRG